MGAKVMKQLHILLYSALTLFALLAVASCYQSNSGSTGSVSSSPGYEPGQQFAYTFDIDVTFNDVIVTGTDDVRMQVIDPPLEVGVSGRQFLSISEGQSATETDLAMRVLIDSLRYQRVTVPASVYGDSLSAEFDMTINDSGEIINAEVFFNGEEVPSEDTAYLFLGQGVLFGPISPIFTQFPIGLPDIETALGQTWTNSEILNIGPAEAGISIPYEISNTISSVTTLNETETFIVDSIINTEAASFRMDDESMVVSFDGYTAEIRTWFDVETRLPIKTEASSNINAQAQTREGSINYVDVDILIRIGVE